MVVSARQPSEASNVDLHPPFRCRCHVPYKFRRFFYEKYSPISSSKEEWHSPSPSFEDVKFYSPGSFFHAYIINFVRYGNYEFHFKLFHEIRVFATQLCFAFFSSLPFSVEMLCVKQAVTLYSIVYLNIKYVLALSVSLHLWLSFSSCSLSLSFPLSLSLTLSISSVSLSRCVSFSSKVSFYSCLS